MVYIGIMHGGGRVRLDHDQVNGLIATLQMLNDPAFDPDELT